MPRGELDLKELFEVDRWRLLHANDKNVPPPCTLWNAFAFTAAGYGETEGRSCWRHFPDPAGLQGLRWRAHYVASLLEACGQPLQKCKREVDGCRTIIRDCRVGFDKHTTTVSAMRELLSDMVPGNARRGSSKCIGRVRCFFCREGIALDRERVFLDAGNVLATPIGGFLTAHAADVSSSGVESMSSNTRALQVVHQPQKSKPKQKRRRTPNQRGKSVYKAKDVIARPTTVGQHETWFAKNTEEPQLGGASERSVSAPGVVTQRSPSLPAPLSPYRKAAATFWKDFLEDSGRHSMRSPLELHADLEGSGASVVGSEINPVHEPFPSLGPGGDVFEVANQTIAHQPSRKRSGHRLKSGGGTTFDLRSGVWVESAKPPSESGTAISRSRADFWEGSQQTFSIVLPPPSPPPSPTGTLLIRAKPKTPEQVDAQVGIQQPHDTLLLGINTCEDGLPEEVQHQAFLDAPDVFKKPAMVVHQPVMAPPEGLGTQQINRSSRSSPPVQQHDPIVANTTQECEGDSSMVEGMNLLDDLFAEVARDTEGMLLGEKLLGGSDTQEMTTHVEPRESCASANSIDKSVDELAHSWRMQGGIWTKTNMPTTPRQTTNQCEQDESKGRVSLPAAALHRLGAAGFKIGADVQQTTELAQEGENTPLVVIESIQSNLSSAPDSAADRSPAVDTTDIAQEEKRRVPVTEIVQSQVEMTDVAKEEKKHVPVLVIAEAAESNLHTKAVSTADRSSSSAEKRHAHDEERQIPVTVETAQSSVGITPVSEVDRSPTVETRNAAQEEDKLVPVKVDTPQSNGRGTPASVVEPSPFAVLAMREVPRTGDGIKTVDRGDEVETIPGRSLAVDAREYYTEGTDSDSSSGSSSTSEESETDRAPVQVPAHERTSAVKEAEHVTESKSPVRKESDGSSSAASPDPSARKHVKRRACSDSSSSATPSSTAGKSKSKEAKHIANFRVSVGRESDSSSGAIADPQFRRKHVKKRAPSTSSSNTTPSSTAAQSKPKDVKPMLFKLEPLPPIKVQPEVQKSARSDPSSSSATPSSVTAQSKTKDVSPRVLMPDPLSEIRSQPEVVQSPATLEQQVLEVAPEISDGARSRSPPLALRQEPPKPRRARATELPSVAKATKRSKEPEIRKVFEEIGAGEGTSTLSLQDLKSFKCDYVGFGLAEVHGFFQKHYVESFGGVPFDSFKAAYPSLNPFMINKRKNEVFIRKTGSLHRKEMYIEDLDDCEVYVCDRTEQTFVDGCKRCVIMLAPCNSSTFVRDCEDCVLWLATKQFRTRKCERCTFYLYAHTEPIIEMSIDLVIAPWCAKYPKCADHFKELGFDPERNLWNAIFDFSGVANHSNWSISNLSDVIELTVELDESPDSAASPENPVPEVTHARLIANPLSSGHSVGQGVANIVQTRPALPPTPKENCHYKKLAVRDVEQYSHKIGLGRLDAAS